MPDHAMGELQRIALVFGEVAAAAHVRDAVAGHVDIVYAAPAADFDPARANSEHVAAILVNLDAGGDWLSTIEARLRDVEAHVVYNDPEISAGLEGWERARWLRHLLAKLRGSNDVDPPRPAAPVAAAVDQAAPAAGTDDLPAAVMHAQAAISVAPEASGDAGGDADMTDPLDVDTEALSAALDARLADADADAKVSQDGASTWRVAPRGPEPPAVGGASTNEPSRHAAGGACSGPATGTEASAAPDESDPFATLSSLDDWELVDPEATIAHAPAPKAPEPELPDNFPDLELVPMDKQGPVRKPMEPVERWLDRSHRPAPGTPQPRESVATDPDGSAP